MTADELRVAVQKFSDRPSDVVLGRDRIVAQVHGQLVEAELRTQSGMLFCRDGGVEETAEQWVVRRLGQVDVLAQRILEFTPKDANLVPIEADVLETVEQNVEERTSHVDDVVCALAEILGGLPPASTDVIYLTSDAGEGKTCVMESLARRQAERYVDGRASWLVVPVALAGRPFLRLDEVIIGTLSNRLRFRMLYYEGLLELVKRGAIVLGLDGFEEMFVETQSGEVVSSLGNLVSRLDSQGALLFAARKAYYHYSNLHAQAKLFSGLRDSNVSFSEVRLCRWKRPQFIQCCVNYGLTTEEAGETYESFSRRLGADHPVLTRAVLARKVVEEVVAGDGATALAQTLEGGDNAPEALFERFVAALIDREAREKWIDRSGEVASALLSQEEHHALLKAVAEEMWISGTDVLPGHLVETTAEVVVESLGHGVTTVRQARERIKQHALLQRVAGSDQYGFDHDEFRAFYLGLRVKEVIEAGKTVELRRLLSPKPLPDLALRVSARAVCGSEERRGAMLADLEGIAASGSRASYARSNAGALIVRVIASYGGEGRELKGLYLSAGTSGSLCVENVRFSSCTIEQLDIRHGRLRDVCFRECEVLDLVCDDSTGACSGSFDEASVPCVVHLESEAEFVSHYAPDLKEEALRKLGFTIERRARVASTNAGTPIDERITDVDRVFRAFRRATQINENVMQTRLGKRWAEFEKDILPELLRRGILIEIPHRGSGNQRRFKLGVALDALERARATCDGQYNKCIELLVAELGGRPNLPAG